MHDKANKPIGAVCANAFAYAALTLFYIANFVTNKNDRNLKFALQFAKMIRLSREKLTPYAAFSPACDLLQTLRLNIRS